MFTTVHKYTHLPQFMSLIPEPRALAIDALSQDWQGWSMYMFPPFPLLSKVLQRLRTTNSPMVAVTTMVSNLLHLCVDHPSSFHTAGTYCHNRGISRMATHIICTHGGSHAALPTSRIFQKRSIDSQQLLEDPLQTGPQDKELIRLVPQLLK